MVVDSGNRVTPAASPAATPIAAEYPVLTVYPAAGFTASVVFFLCLVTTLAVAAVPWAYGLFTHDSAWANQWITLEIALIAVPVWIWMFARTLYRRIEFSAAAVAAGTTLKARFFRYNRLYRELVWPNLRKATVQFDRRSGEGLHAIGTSGSDERLFALQGSRFELIAINRIDLYQLADAINNPAPAAAATDREALLPPAESPWDALPLQPMAPETAAPRPPSPAQDDLTPKTPALPPQFLLSLPVRMGYLIGRALSGAILLGVLFLTLLVVNLIWGGFWIGIGNLAVLLLGLVLIGRDFRRNLGRRIQFLIVHTSTGATLHARTLLFGRTEASSVWPKLPSARRGTRHLWADNDYRYDQTCLEAPSDHGEFRVLFVLGDPTFRVYDITAFNVDALAEEINRQRNSRWQEPHFGGNLREEELDVRPGWDEGSPARPR